MLLKRLRFIERERPEPRSASVAIRVKPSEKSFIKKFARKNRVTVGTVLRSALVAVGALPPSR